MELDYDEINTAFLEAEAGTRAAECHGFISGYYCAQGAMQIEALRDHLISGLEDAAALEQCYRLVNTIAEQVINTMESIEIKFEILLPDDDEDISERTQALAEWCAGFISGLGVGGLGDKPPLVPACDEFIKDLVNISRMDAVTEDDEDAESALFELVEYIRIGVLMLHQEWHPQTETVNRPEVLH